VNRWKATPPYEWLGAWEGRLQAGCGYGTKTQVCGHLHGSSVEAERCARGWLHRQPKPGPLIPVFLIMVRLLSGLTGGKWRNIWWMFSVAATGCLRRPRGSRCPAARSWPARDAGLI
jgi:hypothetical protein